MNVLWAHYYVETEDKIAKKLKNSCECGSGVQAAFYCAAPGYPFFLKVLDLMSQLLSINSIHLFTLQYFLVPLDILIEDGIHGT
jgi:hypothetical protein